MQRSLPRGRSRKGTPTAIDIAFDVRETSHMSVGMRNYVRELARLVPRLAPDLRFATFGDGDNFGLGEQIGMPLAVARSKPRLVHFPAPFLPLILPPRYVMTIHDLIELEFPQYSKPHAIWYYRNVVGRAARRARVVITDDEKTRAMLQNVYGLTPERVRVIPLGSAERVSPAAPERRARRYLLYAGNHRPHKDLATLFSAWRDLPANSQVDVLVTGNDDFNGSLARYTRDDGRIVVLGNITDAELATLYAGAVAYVHPALSEGFGLPMLEAMRAGTPVVASESAIPGVLREHAVTYATGDAGALRDAIEAILLPSPARAARVAAARATAATLTWERCARETIRVYRELLDAR